METKHTPGPWSLTAIRTNRNIQTLAIDGNGGRSFVAEIAVESRNGGEWLMQKNGEADARLIAAAPDLVEALALVEGMLDAFPGFDSRAVPFTDKATGNIGQVVRAALAKAGVL